MNELNWFGLHRPDKYSFLMFFWQLSASMWPSLGFGHKESKPNGSKVQN